jgi:hypothetical protein
MRRRLVPADEAIELPERQTRTHCQVWGTEGGAD